MEDMLAIIRTTPIGSFIEVAANICREFCTVHDQDTLVAVLLAMAAARVDTANQLHQEAALLVGDGEATLAAFWDLLRRLDEIRHQRHHNE